MWGLPNGQMLNILMVIVGVIALSINIYTSRSARKREIPASSDKDISALGLRRFGLVALCLLPLVIPSDATRDVPATYGARHPRLEHSRMYPNIADALAAAEREKEREK